MSTTRHHETVGDDGIIQEDEAEQTEHQSEQEQLEKDIKEFLKKSRIHMQMQNNIGKTLSKTDAFAKREKEGGFPSMKGNIGPSSKLVFEKDNSYQAQ